MQFGTRISETKRYEPRFKTRILCVRGHQTAVKLGKEKVGVFGWCEWLIRGIQEKKNLSEILNIKNNLIRYLGKDKTGIKLMLLSLMYYLIRECYLLIILLNDDFCD